MFAATLLAQRLTTRISCKLGRNPGDETIAAEVVIVSPDEMAERPAAFALPGQMDRVKATPPDTNLPNEMSRIGGGPILHDATKAMLLRNVQYFDGFIYCHGARRQQVVRPEPIISGGPVEHIAECSLPATTVGDQFFGHFLIDDSSAALLAPRFATPRLPRPTLQQTWSHAQPYRDRLGLSAAQIGTARIDRAWVFRDHGMTADRRARMAELRRRMRAPGGERQGHGVFILRSGGQARNLLNEAAIADHLSREGFEIVDPARQSVADIAAKLHDAALVCSVEGSAFAHGLLSMAEGAAMVAIQPPFLCNNPWKDYTDALGMGYGYVVAEGGPTEFSLDVDSLMRTLELASV